MKARMRKQITALIVFHNVFMMKPAKECQELTQVLTSGQIVLKKLQQFLGVP